MKLKFEANNPLLVGAALIIIISLIYFLQVNSPERIEPGERVSIDLSGFLKAPELQGIKGYINADESLKLSDLKGKVVLIDFWTYSCINCIRTLPYLKAWHEKYSDEGLVIIGVHTPEFEFEKKFENVKTFVEKQEIKYAVVLDNDYVTWRAFQNNYWPHKYLIDKGGLIRFDHIGEGAYDETEKQIQMLLEELNKEKSKEVIEMRKEETVFSKIKTPEIYFGYEFLRQPLGSIEGIKANQITSYKLPEVLQKNLAFLEGEWKALEDHLILVSETGKVALRFEARKANIVAGSEQGSELTVMVNGAEVNEENKGTDSIESNEKFLIQIKDQKLYNIVSLPEYSEAELVFEVKGKGFEIYSFTFG